MLSGPGRPAEHFDTDGMPAPRRHWAYATILIGLVMAVLDATVANVALPTIAGDFHATAAHSIEIVSAYQLIIVMLLLPLSALGDIYGYRRVYIVGLCVFTVASLACALADSLAALTVARILQGCGAAGIMSVNTALIRHIFPRNGLGRAIGFNAMTVAVSSTVGPSFASVVLGVASWNWLFAVNVPIGVVALMIAIRSLPFSNRGGHKFDVPSALLTAASLGLFITAIDSLSHEASWTLIAVQAVLGCRRCGMGRCAAVAYAGTVIAGGSVADPHLHPLGLHVDLLLRSADAGFCRTAVLHAGRAWLQGDDGGISDHAVALRGRRCGADCGRAGGSLSGGDSGVDRHGVARLWDGVAGFGAAASECGEHRLADGDLRFWVRVVPGAE